MSEFGWPHCEKCNFPLQDQGTPNGLVCLLCNVREERDKLRAEQHEAIRMREFFEIGMDETAKERDQLNAELILAKQNLESAQAMVDPYLMDKLNADLTNWRKVADELAEVVRLTDKEACQILRQQNFATEAATLHGECYNALANHSALTKKETQ